MVSALNHQGLDKLEKRIIELSRLNNLNEIDATYLTNARQIAKLENAYKAVLEAISSANEYLPVDMVEIDIKRSWDELGEIIGVGEGDALINELFSKFCLGK